MFLFMFFIGNILKQTVFFRLLFLNDQNVRHYKERVWRRHGVMASVVSDLFMMSTAKNQHDNATLLLINAARQLNKLHVDLQKEEEEQKRHGQLKLQFSKDLRTFQNQYYERFNNNVNNQQTSLS